ncbi:MAG: hypothetical protein OEW42_05355 [Acidimicrobiia bacterium]|nr:hypothetical protein [Acidimicrobiia bacterium]MDH5236377.1 hypothetical protein [Acidimicrobiia bacterium]
MTRTRRRTSLVAIVAALAMVATACQIDVAATTLHVVAAQEDGFLQNGDEPYVAVIQWRVIPGEAGSTQVSFLGNLAELGSGMDDGDDASIPAAMGAASFANVQVSSISQVAQGQLPELVGTVMVVMESDLTSWGTINGLMGDVEDALANELENQIEPLTILDLTNPQVVASALSTAAANVEAAVTPGIFDQILIWLGSLGNPDDLIGVGFTVWIAAGGTLGQFIESTLPAALPANAAGGVWYDGLDPKTATVRFSGDGAIYDVDIVATNAPPS